MVIMLTNGVSFELVAGACCLVTFNNHIVGHITSSPTLNINSTGAKTLRSAGTHEYSSYNTTWWGFAAAAAYAHYPAMAFHVLAAYDGSAYRCNTAYEVYGDYSD